MYSEKIGVLGGFGGYATLEFYKNFLVEFASESERNYPHILFDNDFTMPSRTRALLYGDDYEEVVNGIAASIKTLCEQNVSYIIMVCGTAHGFLNDVYCIVPEAQQKVLNIIELTAEKLLQNKISQAMVIAAEGTLQKNIYGDCLEAAGIKCTSPSSEHYAEIRKFIESVKQNNISEETSSDFLDFLDSFGITTVILGCTEFPALIEYISAHGSEEQKERLNNYLFYNPLKITLKKLKQILH